jgi:hypothetical protein
LKRGAEFRFGFFAAGLQVASMTFDIWVLLAVAAYLSCLYAILHIATKVSEHKTDDCVFPHCFGGLLNSNC